MKIQNTMKRILLILFFSIYYFTAGAQQLYSFVFDGIERTYRVHLPAGFDINQQYPLVINMHGLGSNSFEQEFYTEFDQVADTSGIVMAYPDGVNNQWNIYQDGGVNDVGFISALIDTMHANYNIDFNRVYACGMSMGGFMSHRLGCQLNGRIAAIGSVAGLIVYFNCNFTRKVPVIQIHGTADDVVPYDGVAYTIQYWTMNNYCPDSVVTELPDIDTNDSSTVTLTSYSPCFEDTEVLLYTINGGEHTWPGASYIIGVTNQDIHASTEIWNFFKKFTLSGYVGSKDLASMDKKLKIFPHPVSGTARIEIPFHEDDEWNLQVYDMSGRLVRTENGLSGNSFSFSRRGLNPGLYFIEISSGKMSLREKLLVN